MTQPDTRGPTGPRILPAEIVTAPRIEEREVDGATFAIYGADVALASGEDEAPRLWCVLPGDAPGVAWAFAVGDRVWALVVGGMAVAIKHIGTSVAAGGHHRLIAPAGAQVQVGAATGGAWQAFMLHTVASEDLFLLRARDNYIATWIQATMEALTPGSGDTWREGFDALGEVQGGKASFGAQGRPG